jgi:hypothetical protein
MRSTPPWTISPPPSASKEQPKQNFHSIGSKWVDPQLLEVRGPDDLPGAFAAVRTNRADALILSDPPQRTRLTGRGVAASR